MSHLPAASFLSVLGTGNLPQQIFCPLCTCVHTNTHTNSGVHADVHSQKHKHKPLSVRHQAVIEAPGSPTHTCTSAISHPKACTQRCIQPHTLACSHQRTHKHKYTSTQHAKRGYHSLCCHQIFQSLPGNYRISFRIHLCNVRAACLGLEQLYDRMDENHSPEGP